MEGEKRQKDYDQRKSPQPNSKDSKVKLSHNKDSHTNLHDRSRSVDDSPKDDPLNTSTTSTSAHSNCIPECSTKSSKNMIRCMLCMTWFHTKCAKERSDYQGVFTCLDCRQIPKMILNISSVFADVLKQVHDLNTTTADLGLNLDQLKNTVETDMSSLKLTNQELTKENQKLKLELQQIKHDHNISKVMNNAMQPIPEQRKPSLLIGSSIIGDIQSSNPNELNTKCLPGAKMANIKQSLNESAQNDNKYQTIYVVAGSNDCKQSSSTPESIAQETQEVADVALQICEKVVISSILPRTDDGTAQLKAENVNLKLKSLCDQNPNIVFCDNDCTFRLNGGSINNLLLWNDGHHLRYVGSERLIKNLKIKATVRRRSRQSLNNPSPPSTYNRYQQRQPTTVNQNPQNVPPLLQMPPRNAWIARTNSAVCRNCLQPDHDTYKCPLTANRRCFNCGSLGYLQKDCLS